MEKGEGKKETRRINRTRIARLIAEAGMISKNEISVRLGLSMPTVLQGVRELEDEGIVEEVGEYGSTGGRKAKGMSIAENAAYGAGMDVAKGHIDFVMVSLKGKLVKKARIRLPFIREFSYYEAAGNWLQVFLEQSGVEKRKIQGVGIALPGEVDQKEKLLIRSQILGVENISFRRFEDMAGYPCYLENDVNGAAYGEFAGEKRDGVYLALNDQVGGAVFLRGSLYGGESGRGVRFGHMRLKEDGRLCRCGGRGCVDAYCSAAALLGEDSGLDVFFERVRGRQEGYRERLDEYLGDLAVFVVNMRMAFGCDVVLGGKVGAYLKDFRRELDKKAAECDFLDSDMSFLRIGKCRQEAAAYGVAIQCAERFFDRI